MLIYDLQKNTKLGEFFLFERSEKSKNGKTTGKKKGFCWLFPLLALNLKAITSQRYYLLANTQSFLKNTWETDPK
ncbi:hypothetical protein MASR1M29_23300 [Cloacibacterium normanense]